MQSFSCIFPYQKCAQKKLGFGESCLRIKDAELLQALICVHIQAEAFLFFFFLLTMLLHWHTEDHMGAFNELYLFCFIHLHLLLTSISVNNEYYKRGGYGICLICTYMGLIIQPS